MALSKKSAERKVGVVMTLAEKLENGQVIGLTLKLVDEDSIAVQLDWDQALVVSKQADQALENVRKHLAKLGGTDFYVLGMAIEFSQAWFVPASALNNLRRQALQALQDARLAAWVRPKPTAPVEPPLQYPEKSLSFLANVYNGKARAFYAKHGVEMIAAAYELHEEAGEVPVMITKHCLRFSFNLCPKQAKGVQGVQGQVKAEPMTLVNGDQQYTLKFDCKPCEMHVMGTMRPEIFNSPPLSVVPITFVDRKLHNKRLGG